MRHLHCLNRLFKGLPSRPRSFNAVRQLVFSSLLMATVFNLNTAQAISFEDIPVPSNPVNTGLISTALNSVSPIPKLDTVSRNDTYQPVKIAVQPGSASEQAYSGYKTITSPRLPLDTDFSPEAQRESYLTQFIMTYNKKLNWEQSNLIATAILDFSNRYTLDFRLVTGVIAVESSFRTDAISKSGAIGLGQLKPKTAQWLGVVNPYDPIDNVAGMSRYLRYLITKYNGSLDHAVSAYFQGQGTIDRGGISDTCKNYLYRLNNVLSLM
ncbi:MAG: lytic transglycosylase domain-containing protein [Cyanobacteria bacterium]|nr:lytic transglycosylase domain-containing protein [Cyanobacteriota bacterium]